MKIAIISDIHGNLTALEAILPAIKEADHVVCLGDVALVGPQPREVIGVLRRSKWPCVLGNTDEELVKSTPGDYAKTDMPESERQKMMALDRWTISQLRGSERGILSRFKPTIEASAGTLSLLCYHGSPRSNTEGILPTLPEKQLADALAGRRADLYAGGHTHAQMVRRFGSSVVINPGSVGLPYYFDAAGAAKNPAWAEYAMVTVSGDDLKVEMRRTRYSLDALRDAVRGSGMPEPEWWLSDWV